jgi:hypothetical protein
LDCGWYIDYRKENIPPSKFEIREKTWTEIFLGIWSLGERETKQKKIGGGKKKGEKKTLGV